ncbi:MAG: F0F1 ATP synthase subunit delta [Candidatus Caldatribacteriaceae bacterium]
MNNELVKVVTPLPLNSEQREIIRAKIGKLLGNDFFSLEEEVDESLIGGVVVFLRGFIIDCSIRTQLEKIKESILKGE